MIASGIRPRTAFLSMYFSVPLRVLSAAGMLSASSTNLWSRKGTRPSSDTPMLVTREPQSGEHSALDRLRARHVVGLLQPKLRHPARIPAEQLVRAFTDLTHDDAVPSRQL